jgi:branched-subunit amino acid permease
VPKIIRIILYQILESHRPEEKCIIHLYTNVLLVHLGLSISIPRMLDEAHNMAKRIKKNISLSKIRRFFTSCTFSVESLFSLETFTIDFQEEGEQNFDQQGREKNH